MILTEFLTKVNLEKFCRGENIEGYKFLKIPSFGWVAYKDKTKAYTIFDIAPIEVTNNIYDYIIRHKPQYLDCRVVPSLSHEKIFKRHLKNYLMWQIIYRVSLHEMKTHTLQWKSPIEGRGSPREFLAAQGIPALDKNELGFITDTLNRKFPGLPWAENSAYKKYILIPVFVAPGVITSIEYSPWNNIKHSVVAYSTSTTVAHKYYGKINGKILNNIEKLNTHEGCTWSPACLPWLDENIDVSDDLSVEAYFEILLKLGPEYLKIKPKDFFLSAARVEEAAVAILKFKQSDVWKIEELTGLELKQIWRNNYRSTILIDKTLYEKRADGYWEYTKGLEKQITNFTVDIQKFYKKKTYHHIVFTVSVGEHVVDIDISYRKYCVAIPFGAVELFLDYGLPIPMINPHRVNYIQPLILMFYKQENETI